MNIYLPIIRADFCIYETYSYHSEPLLVCLITTLGGLDDDTFNSQDLLKWQEQTSASFQYGLLPGNHFFIKSAYQKVISMVNKILYEELTQVTPEMSYLKMFKS
jgi:medium-chain acyl-[acyl-carrier-protein] hydrolase